MARQRRPHTSNAYSSNDNNSSAQTSKSETNVWQRPPTANLDTRRGYGSRPSSRSMVITSQPFSNDFFDNSGLNMSNPIDGISETVDYFQSTITEMARRTAVASRSEDNMRSIEK